MRLHENKKLFQDAVIATSQQKNIPELYVEKDYWVTYTLYNIFKSEIGNETVFKGGTALLKCFGLIQRFSEDIDLVILRNETETGNQLKTKIRNISKCVSNILPEIEMEGITNKVGMIRKTAHKYERLFAGHFGQVRDCIIVESAWLGNFEPFTTEKINSFIYEMMKEKNQLLLIDEYEMNPFSVLVLSPKRTLCEKIMSLVRFSHAESPIESLKNKIRHIYDIYWLLNDKEIYSFFRSSEFEIMLLKVANDDIASFKNNNKWLFEHPATAILFSETKNVWNRIKSVYIGSFSELVFGEMPDETEILKTLTMLTDRLRNIKWNIII
ncbi:MAG: nucleotidyl transferase AbiEii/AbiGii toxin family protein [Bacteroidales bacterium]|nr:nucleotidyl transferase AbiEii/AbiGii toxin family protein [Bacteroidales bacterium]